MEEEASGVAAAACSTAERARAKRNSNRVRYLRAGVERAEAGSTGSLI
jgi:hypothetical protein